MSLEDFIITYGWEDYDADSVKNIYEDMKELGNGDVELGVKIYERMLIDDYGI